MVYIQHIMSKVRIVTASGLCRTFELPKQARVEMLIGSAEYCQIALPDVAGLAPVQACIVCENSGYGLIDMTAPLSAQQGGARYLRRSEPLHPGEVHRVGVISIMLEPDPEPQPEAVAPPIDLLPVQVVEPVRREPERVAQPVQVQIVMADMSGQKPQGGRARQTSRFKRKEASLLLSRFHRHKMHNAYLWSILWMFFSLVLLISVIFLAMRTFAPEKVRDGDILFKKFIDQKIEAYEKEGIPGVLNI